jgi:phosphoglycerate dehydrogenase-like enzyme
MPNVLVGPYHLRNAPGRFREILKAAGFNVIDPVGAPALNEAELRQYLPGAEAILAGGEVLTAAMLDLSPGLRVIARVGVGYDLVDVGAATERRVVLTITPGCNEGSVAEQTFALLLGVARSVGRNDAIIKAAGWDRTLPRPLRGSTLGLLGLGRIGRAVAIRALAFDMKVIAYDPLPPTEFDARHGIRRLPFDQVLAESDVISLHVPLTESTRHLIRRETLGRTRPGSILINTARGALVDEGDLYESLSSGHLAGAGLDVMEREPPAPDNPLLTLTNVVLSPHLGGIDTRGLADMATSAAQSIVTLHAGRWPAECVVNTDVGRGWAW